MPLPVGHVLKGQSTIVMEAGIAFCNGVECDSGTELYNAILMINNLFIQKINITSNKAHIDLYVNDFFDGFLYVFSSHISSSLSLKVTGDSLKWAK